MVRYYFIPISGDQLEDTIQLKLYNSFLTPEGSKMSQATDKRYTNTVQLVEFKDGDDSGKDAKFFVDNLAQTLAPCGDLPVKVISLTGVFRSGKSFLLNIIVTYLQHLQQTVRNLSIITV